MNVVVDDHLLREMLLEIVVFITAEGDDLIIHAMPIRPIYRKLLKR